jgi:uncharacterized membrane protein
VPGTKLQDWRQKEKTVLNIFIFGKAWVVTSLFFLAADSLWLGLIARSFYRAKLGFLMKDAVNFPVAAVFYLMYSAAVVYLASMPGFREGSGATALYAGAVLGLAAYGTYDITNLATIDKWPVSVSVVDLVWGTALSTLAAYVGFKALTGFS